MSYNSKYKNIFSEWVAMYNSGITITEISKKYNCARSNIRRRLVSLGVKIRPYRESGKDKFKWDDPSVAYNALVIKKENDCWGWAGRNNGHGYACFFIKRKCYLAHRYSYEIHNNQSPGNLFVCHSCDNPICSNPDHLFLGDTGANTRDCFIKKRHPWAKLTKDEVIDIKKRIETGESNMRLAAIFNVSYQTIYDIKRGTTWWYI
jgi:hypothetical protein